jgi:chromosomal replication initiator protein
VSFYHWLGRESDAAVLLAEARAQSPGAPIALIQAITAIHYGIDPLEMKSQRRARDVSRPRQVAMYFARELTPQSLPEIGRRFGGRDHTTVMHAIKRVESLCLADLKARADVEALRERLTA